MMGKINYILH